MNIELKDYTTAELEKLESKIHDNISNRLELLPNYEKDCDCEEPIVWHDNIDFDEHTAITVTIVCIKCGGDIHES